MLGPAYYLIGAIALALLQPSSALTATTASEVCSLLTDGTKIYSEEGCSQYYSCSGGVATLATCSSGYSFSRDSQSCQPSSRVACSVRTVDTGPCANADNGAFVSVPNSCTDYYYCSDGVGEKGSCPNGLNFDQASQSCNYTTDYACSSSNNGARSDSTINLCAVVPSGIYFGSSTSCKDWHECSSSGVLTTGVCPSPYYFNVATASCDYKDNVSCRQVTNDPGALAGTACTSNGLIVSDNSTCTGYYLCSNNVYSYSSCTGGLYFNPPTSTCVNRLDAINNCNRCQGTTLEFVNLYEDNCKGYGYCVNGRMESTSTCTNGYFSEVMQACLEDFQEPDFPVCNTGLDQRTTTDAQSTTTEATGFTQSTTTDAAGLVHTQSTTTDAAGLVHTQSTTTDAAGVVHTQSTTTDAASLVHTQSPTTDAAGLVHTQSTTTDAAGLVHTQSTTTDAAGLVHTQSTTTDAAGVVHTQSTTTDAASLVHTQSPTTDAAGLVHTQSTTTDAAGLVHTQSTTTDAAGVVHTQSTTTDAASLVHTQSPTTDAADLVHTQSTTTDAAGLVHTQSTTTDAAGLVKT